jgi:hypothetical protein
MTDNQYDLLEFGRIYPPTRQSPERSLKVGDLARLAVLVNISTMIYPWVEIAEVTPTGYVGIAMNSTDWLPAGVRVAFGFAHVLPE